ncbi:MAG: cupin domain-containing protein [Paracoccaceae bacterium]
MTPNEIEKKIVRYGDLIPCKTAFIDAHTPGSNQKENFTIIGGGVSESVDQHVHLRETPGFNIGAAGQPPQCRNSLHIHTTAEVFFVLKGRWRFFWGRWGTAGEVTLEEGDIINIPTGIFRGFENIGSEYGMIMAILGGDDAGGGVTWAPQVIEDAAEHGLILGENGRLYDSKKDESLPSNIKPMPTLSENALSKVPEPTAQSLIPRHVARYNDLMAFAANEPVKVIGKEGVLPDKPGFEVDFLTRLPDPTKTDKFGNSTVLMPMRGHWKLSWETGNVVLNPGDTCLLEPNFSHKIEPSVTGEASLYRILSNDDPAGPTWCGN